MTPDNVVSNCDTMANVFEEPIYDTAGQLARYWTTLAPTVNVAIKNGFLGIGGGSLWEMIQENRNT